MRYKDFYEKSLYPLQDKIFSVLNQFGGLFFLTGGTALSRFYFNHRYSDDLDFFTREEIKEFKRTIENILKILPSGISWETEIVSGTFARIFVKKDTLSLRVDFVNEVVFHWGEIKEFGIINYVDNEINILANKISAIDRYEVKDIADIWVVAKNRKFLWKDIIEIAAKKALIEPIRVSKIIKTVPKEELNMIKWAQEINPAEVYENLQIIAKDILIGGENTLFK